MLKKLILLLFVIMQIPTKAQEVKINGISMECSPKIFIERLENNGFVIGEIKTDEVLLDGYYFDQNAKCVVKTDKKDTYVVGILMYGYEHNYRLNKLFFETLCLTYKLKYGNPTKDEDNENEFRIDDYVINISKGITDGGKYYTTIFYCNLKALSEK